LLGIKFFKEISMFQKISTGIALLGLMSCAHELSPSKISSNATPSVEIANQRSLMTDAYNAQVDVLAPSRYKKAESYLEEAQKENAKGDSIDKIYESLGYSHAYLDKANEEAAIVRPNLNEVATARNAALVAGARKLPKQLNALDHELKELTNKPDSSTKVSSADKTALQSQYLDLELAAIKSTYLGEAKNTLNLAKKKGAEKITPAAFKQAQDKVSAAEKLIETDRHSDAQISVVVKEATTSTKRVFALLESEQNSRNQTPEQRAMTLESRDNAVKAANLETSEVVADSSMKEKLKDQEIAVKDQEMAVKNETLAIQGQNLAASEEDNLKLKVKEQEDKMVTDAAAQFDKSEADVYRQDGNLVIRLKKMNFASNRADLPASSIAILNKVKEVMKQITPESVIVEGHTDAVGDSKKNQTLSEKRALSVMTFFNSDKTIADGKIKSAGFGYSKPLASNKTKEGRAQNRRVDIVMKTMKTKEVSL
jgi:OOP family OmpA-OmpF porin